MIPYAQQLEIKRKVVRRAYANYSRLDASLVPDILPTMGSPETMHYRTKLTPHFDLPAVLRRTHDTDLPVDMSVSVPIGFDNATTGRVMDIEECPIGTHVLNEAMTHERQRVRDSIRSYKNGVAYLRHNVFTRQQAPKSRTRQDRCARTRGTMSGGSKRLALLAGTSGCRACEVDINNVGSRAS